MDNSDYKIGIQRGLASAHPERPDAPPNVYPGYSEEMREWFQLSSMWALDVLQQHLSHLRMYMQMGSYDDVNSVLISLNELLPSLMRMMMITLVHEVDMLGEIHIDTVLERAEEWAEQVLTPALHSAGWHGYWLELSGLSDD